MQAEVQCWLKGSFGMGPFSPELAHGLLLLGRIDRAPGHLFAWQKLRGHCVLACRSCGPWGLQVLAVCPCLV